MNRTKQILAGLVFAVTVMALRGTPAAAAPAPVDLGAAAPFTILAASTITSTGPTTLNGDLGLWPGTAVTETPVMVVNGTRHITDSVASNAQVALTAAYNDAAGRSPTTSYGAVAVDLGGLTLTSGVYNGSSSFAITGTLTLDAQGDPDAVWIFQAGSTLITATDSSVVLTNGAQAHNVFWQVGTSATLGTGSSFKGIIMAQASIGMAAGSTLDGRALARTAAVTVDSLVVLVSLSISLSPATWAVGTVGMGTAQMSSSGNKITVTNNGNVAETFTLQISNQDDQGQWIHSASKTGAGK